jgi:hypothetical protein
MLVAVALVASMGLAACQKPTTSVAGSTSVADSTSVAPSASASASVSTAPVVKSYYVTVDDTQDMKVVVSTGKAKEGESVDVTVIVASALLKTPTAKANDADITLTVDPVNPDVYNGTFVMPTEDVTVKGALTTITHNITATVPTNVYGLFFTAAPTDDMISAGTYTESIEGATYGSLYYFEPVESSKLDATKMVGDVIVGGKTLEAAGYNDYGDYYAIVVGDSDMTIEVALTDRTYLTIGYSKNSSHVVFNFKGTRSYSYHYSRATAGTKVSFTTTVDAGYGLDYVEALAIDSTTGKAVGAVPLSVDYTTMTYSFTQPAYVIYLVAGIENTAYPVTLNDVAYDSKTDEYGKQSITFRSGITVKHGTDAEVSYAALDGYKAQYGDVVTIKATDGSDNYKITDVTMNGDSLGDPTIDATGDYVYTFIMPASQAVLDIEAAFDDNALTVTASAHFTATTVLYTAAATEGDPDVETALTAAHAGQKIYIKPNATEIQDTTDSKYYMYTAPTATYTTKDSSGNNVDNNVTVNYDSKKSLYYFTMPTYAVTIALHESEEKLHGKDYVGVYYGGANGVTNYKMAIDVTGAITWDTGSTATSDATFTEATDGSVSGSFKAGTYTYYYFIKSGLLGVYRLDSDETAISGTYNVYVMSKNTDKPSAAAYATDSTNKTYLYSITPNGSTTTSYVWFDMTAKAFKLGVAVTIIKGTNWNDAGSRIKVMDGTTEIGVYDVTGSYSKSLTKVAKDAVAGSYKIASAETDTLTLDGYGIGTLNDVAGTYTVDSATQVTFVSVTTTTTGKTVTSTVLTLDTTAKTYTAGTPTTVTLPLFAGTVYQGTYEYDYYNDNSTLKITFSGTAMTLDFKLTSDDSSEDSYSFADIAYTYDSTTGIISFTMNNASGTATAFTLTYTASTNTMKMNQAYGSGTYKSSTTKITLKAA